MLFSRATTKGCHLANASLVTTRSFSSTRIQKADFTHAVIGAGAVGLAIAKRLQQVEGASVVLIEKHGIVGSETSSRNSEVIHAGLYYGHDSLKTKLCLQGKQMMYDYCSRNQISHMNCGKWVVAQDDSQMGELQKVHEFASSIGVPVRFISSEEAKRREPDVRAQAGALESPSTGIVDSHGFMQFMHGEFEELGGTTALASPVTRIQAPGPNNKDWRIWTAPPSASEPQPFSPSAAVPEVEGEDTSITAETIVNSAGLYACGINNMILPKERHRTPFYAKGTYFSYSKSMPKPKTLIYPAPVPGHGGLGTHLTLDMSGRVRFGPDVEWVDSPNDLAPSPNNKRFAAALEDIKSYLPGIDTEAVALDYAGIRPKLGKLGAVASGKGFQDFYIKMEKGYNGFVNLLGIESPGLTSSLAIAEEVYEILYKGGKASKSMGRQEEISEPGKEFGTGGVQESF
ncbi:hypothetical protein LTR62_004290 [Meristemomyces frigidus]|uniref:L-2-hydroxyglutarate dehydrogenase, mitochondrial n=1 Tax=Meristemomyces frigidus TaxID=1508187 RepID=A0AAN7THW4_9PEZI|nr:hypothetical protein LTR62_004290 [Meristemomyces frigidus]